MSTHIQYGYFIALTVSNLNFFIAVGPLDELINLTIEYCSQRKAFGQSVLDNQVVHYRLAELSTEVELLRSLLYRTVGKHGLFTFVLH